MSESMNEAPPRGNVKMITQKPWEILGFACVFYDVAPNNASKEAAKQLAMGSLGRVTWEEALDFYRHTDPDWKRAVSLVVSGRSPEDAWRNINATATDIVEFGLDDLRTVTPLIRYWENLREYPTNH